MARLVLCLLTSMSVVFAISPVGDPPIGAPTTRPGATSVVRPPSIDGLSTGHLIDMNGAVFFEVREGGTASLLPNGMVHIVEPCLGGGDEDKPNVLWYCMQSTGLCATCAFAPYATPAPPYLPGYPNPNLPSGNHLPNISRYWAGEPPVYYVWMPNGAASGGVDVFAANPLAGFVAYTYGEFMWDAAFAMARYGAVFNTAGHPALPNIGDPIIYSATPVGHPCLPVVASPAVLPPTIGNPNTSIFAIFGGISAPPTAVGASHLITNNYVWTNSALGNPPNGISLIWSATPAAGVAVGPTGDGVNELIFLPIPASPATAPVLGMTSMIMDPTTGQIQECDILWNSTPPAGAFQWPDRNQTPTGCAVPPLPFPNCYAGGPGWTTAIPHEIGHFFGIDHTNLHPGKAAVPGNGGQQYACQPVACPWSPCAATAAGPVQLAGYPLSLAFFPMWADVPDMAAAYSAPGAWRCDPRVPSQRDDAAAMAEIYPVTAVGQIPSGVPAGATPGALTAAINNTARVEGMLVLTAGGVAVPVFGCNVLVLPSAQNVALVGKLSGTGRRTPGLGVVGAVDTTPTASGAFTPTSGEFVIPSVPVQGKQIAVLAESVGCLGMSPTPMMVPPGVIALNWREWLYDFNFNPVLNSVLYAGPNQVRLVSNGLTTPALLATAPNPVTGLPAGSGVPGGLSIGSLFLVKGSVVQVAPDLGFPGPAVVEAVSRPVVAQLPRNGYAAGGVITVTVVHDYALNFAGATWSVVGGGTFPAAKVAAAPMVTNQPNPPGVGPFTTTFTTTFAKLGITGGGVTLRFSVKEVANGAPGGPPVGVAPLFGVNEVVF